VKSEGTASIADATVEELQAELTRERSSNRLMQRRLETKERELQAIYQSRAWSLLSSARALKYRYLDPILGVFGIAWPRRRVNLHADSLGSLLPASAIPSSGTRYDVVCLAICDWDFRFMRPQQLMTRFGAAGYRVFYVSQSSREDGPAWTLVEKAPHVYEVTLRGEALFETFDAFRRDLSVTSAVTIVQLPSWWPLARRLRETFDWPIVYDCMDLHADFATARRAMVAEEKALLAAADIVTVSSALLEEHARGYRDDVLMLRNGCDYEHFAQTSAARNARPVIGYYGAISDWFDSDLVAELAARKPEWDFILVGSTFNGDISRLRRLPNVAMPGEEPYEALPEWLGRFDVTILPFRRTPLTEATNPVKLYEILAAGRPLVSVPIPEVAAVAPLVRLANNASEFEREIEAALAEDAGAVDARRAYARQNTWQQRYDTLSAALEVVVPHD
jgi:hypothetical protein